MDPVAGPYAPQQAAGFAFPHYYAQDAQQQYAASHAFSPAPVPFAGSRYAHDAARGLTQQPPQFGESYP